MQQLLLSTGWWLKQRDRDRALPDDFATAEGWLPASAPGSVHQDLLAAGHIPDPFVGLNEQAVQWVGESDWLYRCSFDLPPGFADGGAVALCCDGLDTFATVWLNGEQVLASDNMFVPRRAAVGRLLRPGGNEPRILFEAASLRGKQREAEHGPLQAWNGDASRVYVRKAQYHYGWDWGPTLLTAGPWRAIRLEAYTARIAEIACPAEVAADLSSAALPVRVEIEAAPGQSGPLALRLQLYAPAGELIGQALVPIAGQAASHTFTVAAPRLWWPNGYGEQPLYRLAATLEDAAAAAHDQRELRLGLRRLRLVQEPLAAEPGTTFLFEVNNTRIFCGGANWIPSDSFTPRVAPERYRAQLQQAAEAHMVMLRVWGGGIYEEDVFYDLCDELGLLVWQDFMFACGIYPALDWFQASVRAEAEATVKRLRHHACLALWCGNNEDYQIAESIKAYDAAFDGDFTATRFPARAIYERLLPRVCAALDPARAYWPGSPYGGAHSFDQAVGDVHVWGVWHGAMAPYQQYPRLGGRFVSEFGMQALPVRATIESFAPPEERYAESRTLEHHNKASEGPRRLAVYLSDTVRAPADLDSYIYASQLVQAEALAAAYRGWRRRWGGPGRQAVAGALVWQLNDCWPVTSWAIVDYALRPKPAYYVVRRQLAPLVVGLAHGPDGASVWAVSSDGGPIELELELRAHTLEGELVAEERRAVALPPNQAIELDGFGFDTDQSLVIGARLLRDGVVVARAALWPEPFKYLTLPDPLIEAHRLGEDRVAVRAERPAKGVLLAAGDGVTWSDNFLDLLPGDEQIVVARGLGDAPLHVQWLR